MICEQCLEDGISNSKMRIINSLDAFDSFECDTVLQCPVCYSEIAIGLSEWWD